MTTTAHAPWNTTRQPCCRLPASTPGRTQPRPCTPTSHRHPRTASAGTGKTSATATWTRYFVGTVRTVGEIEALQ